MVLIVGEQAPGTSEQQWSCCAHLGAAPTWLPPAVERVVVVAPHPDDETLAIGGLLSILARREVAVTIVAVTDGEASHPRSPTVSRNEMAVRRGAEQVRALAELGGAPRVIRLGIADGGAAAARGAIEDLLAPAVAGAQLCFAPYCQDGHPDHDAVGAAARAACLRRDVPFVEYPIWAWHWARPNTDDLPWARARRVALDAEARLVKAAAIAAYGSQIAPLSAAPGDEAILPPPVLARFRRPFEVVFT